MQENTDQNHEGEELLDDEPQGSKIEEETSEPEMMMNADDSEDEDFHDGCDDGDHHGGPVDDNESDEGQDAEEPVRNIKPVVR